MKDIVENDKIVITGISGKFPQCANVEEFKEALLSGVDLIKENSQRYPAGVMGVPKRSGVLLDIDKFDASFFGIHPKQTDFTDPRHRILLETVYESIIDAGYNPAELRGSKTGTPVGDIIECESLRKHFCQKRNEPLLIGSVKSNMGHSEVASGLCSLTKAVFAMEEGIIPANIHTEFLDSTLPGVKENQLKVVTKNTKFNGGIIGVNCFGFGGANTHIVIDSNKKEKSAIVYKRPKNRLVQVSGRTEEAVLHFLNGVEKNQDDQEFLAMVDEIHKLNVKGHNYRGYTVLGEHQIKEIGKYNKQRPIWFVYTGMGSQWNKMGRDLLNIPIFKSTINRCAKALEPYGVDLLNVITSEDPKVFDNFTNLFSGIGSIEIALTDLLHSLNIYPDGICGHSLGEVGCSYADGQISVEQAALLGYARGYAASNSSIIPGQMAAIGLSKEKVSKMLPEGIFIACQNAKESVTISGPLEKTKAFVEQLSAQGIFAKLVNSGGIPYHTKYVKEAGELLLDFCKLVLPDPKPRSEKWISSSVPESKKHEKWAQLNCAEYHHNNFCNTVLFDQVFSHIPENAIVIEVSPHGLLQAILKREMGPEATQISITNRSSDDNEKFFLSAIGKFYLAGGQPNLRKLYNEVSFPVSRGTKMLSSLVKWDHSVSWFSKRYEHKSSCGISVNVSLSDEEYAYIEGHQIDGRILMPATGYIDLIWNIVADFNLKNKEELPIVMENIKFKRATIVTHGEGVTFTITIMKQSGYFEIFESGAVVCTGYVRIPKDVSSEFKENDVSKVSNSKEITLQEHEIYQECQLRRYMYKNYFRGLSECDLNGRNGKLQWKGKFASFFDTMLHITIIGIYSRESLLPTSIRQITVDPIKHLQMVEKNKKELLITFNPCQSLIKSGGIEIIGTEYSKAPRRQHTQEPPYCESYSLVNYSRTDRNEYDLETAMSIAMQIILQNNTGTVKQIKICEIITTQGNAEIDPCIKNIMAKQVLSRIEYFSSRLENLKNKFQAIIVNEKEVKLEDLNKVVHNLTENGFIIFKGTYKNAKQSSLEVIFESIFGNDKMYLLKPTSALSKNYAVLNISNTNLDWLENLKNLGKTDEEKTVYLVSENEDFSGIIGLTKCLLTETTKLRFRAFLIDQHASKFAVDDPFYKNQLKKDLTFNVLQNNNWATYVHLPLKDLNKQNVGNATVSINTLGDLSTLEWTEMHFEGRRISEESELVYVYYSALNFKDVMIALGKIPIDCNDIVPTKSSGIGLEFSGVTASGKRIMGFVNGDGLALQVQCDPYFTWEIPNEWTLRDACTIPCVYATCYYGLIIRAQMQPGESILIHAGTGGIGLAAINIALSMGCEVYTTVSTKEKKEFLKSIFPSIKDKNIGNSRDASFETMINNNTNGRGVDLVLNSLADTLFQASVRCVAPGGRFIEIGKVDLMNSSPIPTSMFLKIHVSTEFILTNYLVLIVDHNVKYNNS
ncbi:unnamed protein product [Diabrotica balteata]|uniref:Uncharacterized protein n=1 Tax=Diabrotica balteata TaxID=107213 RepID=A0A9N9X7I0_DIABA|nr:unnamed protein product [Diabrotica balteata]